jgi:hypothetical protein
MPNSTGAAGSLGPRSADGREGVRSMFNRARRTKKFAVVGAVALAIAGLTGCSSPNEQAAEQLTEELVEAAGDGQVDIDIEDDSMTIADDEGNEMALGQGVAIPDTWPDYVPMFNNGTVVMATVQPDAGASAVWETNLSVDEAADTYDAQLIAAGFTLDQDVAVEGAIVRGYSSQDVTISVSIAEESGSTMVTVAGAMN